VSPLGEHGDVVVHEVTAEGAFYWYPLGPTHQVMVLRRIWRRAGRNLATLEGRYVSGELNGRRIQVDLATGRSDRPWAGPYFLQVAFWRDARGIVLPGGFYAPDTGLLDLTALRDRAGTP
jgi:hypothetical protein